MIYKRLRNQITQGKLIILADKPLYFYSSFTRLIKSGSMCILGCPEGIL
jgi:hypothetical protein